MFPLRNDTGKPDMDWLSIGLQDSLTVDLWYVSGLNTLSLAAAFTDQSNRKQFKAIQTMQAGATLAHGITTAWKAASRFLISGRKCS